MAVHCHNTGALPVTRLHEIHDCLTLALDATERPSGYSQSEREARSYVRAALRRVGKLMEGVV
ncbi:hypothetical protein [Paracoccus sp. (in: a-proteobacteria)]|uniref:hypothetical protein n=1 Tax=Paracoccus sp. TaxID=267 RepID=UPI002AFE8825|nr:hypothetical protein [Paracoccus sp. (in: a-proteobacteria)]